MKCMICGFESDYLDDVCYWDINGNSYNTQYEVDNALGNPDSLAYELCMDCADEFDFE